MKIIGITGGVGAGKSTVLKELENRWNAVVCEADEVAKSLEEPGQTCYLAIVAHFGEEILKQDGSIDREKLAADIFRDEKKRNELNRIVHPAVKQEIRRRIQEEKEKGSLLFVIEAALLLEEHYETICDEIWYIYAGESVRRMRLKESRGYSDEKIDRIFLAQQSEETFRRLCQRVIHNEEDFQKTCGELEKAVESICQRSETKGE